MIEMHASVNAVVSRRLGLLTLLASLGFVMLVFRLFHLQILSGSKLYLAAELNRTEIIPLRAPRGSIRDRHGEVLVGNAPRFSLFYSAQSVSREAERDLEKELARWFQGSEKILRRKIAEARQTGKMVRLFPGIPHPVALALIEQRTVLPGINVVVEPQRHAWHGSLASHLVGYVDEIGPAELTRLRSEGYRMGQLIGKTGVERSYDAVLRGEDGGLQFEMDAGGHHVRVVRQIPSRSGSHVFLTLDRVLQQAMEEGLRDSPTRQGAAVAVDPRSGAVLAMASQPDFNPATGPLAYLEDPRLPLFNRTIQGGYPPGSTFKLITAAAALQEGNWDVRQDIVCTGVYRLGRKEFACWKTHGRLDFLGAVTWSCNVYFYNVGLRTGPDAIERAGRAFGLGEKTGIDLPSESAGLLPGRRWKKETQGDDWYEGDTLNFSIGQGALSATPLQMAMAVSALANGGILWKPSVLERVVDPAGRVLYQRRTEIRKRVDLSAPVWELLRSGMQEVVRSGTGRGVFRPDLVLGAKTGTAQNPHGEDHAWFVAYAGYPGQEPSLAVAVLVEHGGQGSSSADPVARQVINAAFPLRGGGAL